MLFNIHCVKKLHNIFKNTTLKISIINKMFIFNLFYSCIIMCIRDDYVEFNSN